ncbi:isochorismatase [Ureibacillus massiliensis 4400831 = CIP 108448 = CCUG 49529]|uniref:Isochorismatase n=1 Tax=Ureibacillus massiliensis 4400831 = CIP 108448 = CCUG 49529 TaxID=1211035 RepID=A0A0A3J6P2_9BACL|nr:hydrolase [Ureibacillus massiliensis]KGR91390.1 isochorismatase [Ureibacillus massiliensis 4400831 = CIP 108448 = CCUG 49529]
MLHKEDTVLVLIDIQGKLARIVDKSEFVIQNIANVVQGAKVLGLPILWLEQYPKGLGPTVEEIAQHLDGQQPIEKITFSAYDTPEFVEQLEATGRKKVLLAGIETHICVYQTAAQLLFKGYEVEVLADCVSSRTSLSSEIGLQKMVQIGAKVSTVEMALFEMQQIAKGDEFKSISKIIK